MLENKYPLSCDQSFYTGTQNSYAILFWDIFFQISSVPIAWVIYFLTSVKISDIVMGCNGNPKLVV